MDETERVEMTTLVDNYVDIFLPDGGETVYPKPGQLSSLIAEQGFSIFVKSYKGSKELSILYDFGRSKDVLMRNASLLGIPLKGSLDYLVLSHGHIDHYGSLIPLLKEEGLKMPFVIIHPDAFLTRYMKFKNGRKVGPWKLEMDVFEERGGLIQTTEAVHLGDGIMTSGEIERLTDFELRMEEAYRVEGETLVHDPITDDTSLIINVKEKGLIVITGCAHAGLINIIRHAIKLTHIDRIYGVIGGFHLNHSSEKQLCKTIEILKELDIKLLSPMHCTGFYATSMMSRKMRTQFVPNCVGAKIMISSPDR